MKRTAFRMLLVMTLGLVPPAQGAQEPAYEDLVRRLVDFRALAAPPVPGETAGQWSGDDPAGRRENRTANADGTGVLRREGQLEVLAELEGPGCIWRIGAVRPAQGRVRLYLDGVEIPVFDRPFEAWFDGRVEPFNRPALVYRADGVWHNHTPIPFQKSCRIVAETGWGDACHISYSTFPPGTRVPTFNPDLSEAGKAALDEVDALLSHPGPLRPGQSREGITVERHAFSVRQGGVRMIGIAGPRAITGIRIRLELPESPADRRVLREHTIQIRWDGELQPAVWAPLGDFFGTAPGANPYRTLAAGLSRQGWWYANWYMPFATQAEITIGNDGEVACPLVLEIDHEPVNRPEDLARFHAKWHRSARSPDDGGRGGFDRALPTTEGRGRIVGTHLHVWSPEGGGQGTGPTMVQVDGGRFLSLFGVGTEAAFGMARGDPTFFERAFHSRTLEGDGRHSSVNRWYLADNIPFQRSFTGQLGAPVPEAPLTVWGATVFWYQMPGGHDPHPPVSPAGRTGSWTDP